MSANRFMQKHVILRGKDSPGAKDLNLETEAEEVFRLPGTR